MVLLMNCDDNAKLKFLVKRYHTNLLTKVIKAYIPHERDLMEDSLVYIKLIEHAKVGRSVRYN